MYAIHVGSHIPVPFGAYWGYIVDYIVSHKIVSGKIPKVPKKFHNGSVSLSFLEKNASWWFQLNPFEKY